MSSQDYAHHQAAGIFGFSNGYDRSAMTQQHQQQQEQIRREKARLQGYDHAPGLVGIDEEESVYETAGMLSEMFHYPPGVSHSGENQLLDHDHEHEHGNPGFQTNIRPNPTNDWYNNSRTGMLIGGNLGILNNKSHEIPGINAEAMQLFHMNPHRRSPSPSPHHTGTNSSTLQMLLPNPSPSSLQGFNHSSTPTSAFTVSQPQFTWVPENPQPNSLSGNPTEMDGIVESQRLSLSLSSSLQHLEAAKVEDLRIGDGGLLYYNNQGTGVVVGGGGRVVVGGGGGGDSSSSSQYRNHHQYRNYSTQITQHQNQALHLQPGITGQTHNSQVHHIGYGIGGGGGASSSLGAVNVLRTSKYVKPAQELLEEFCSVGRGQFKKNNKIINKHINTSNPNSNNSTNNPPPPAATSSSSTTKEAPPLSASDRIEHQRRKVKLLSMLDEVDRRYNHYCEQMQMVVNSFDLVMGFGAAMPYTSLAQKAMSRHFRCLKEAISAQVKHSCELLGEKDGAGNSGITKGETPRLKLLEQSLRQQRAFHQMGMMEQEAWRPQRGLPERSVNILRAWLFEHFLHPYPSDADKHLLSRQTGLSRNQVSNWFINARVRLWKPMVEDMYQQESKEEEEEDKEMGESMKNNNITGFAQTTTTTPTETATTTATTHTTIQTITTPKRSEINATDSDPSFNPINTHSFSENQPNFTTTTTASEVVAPPTYADPSDLMHNNRISVVDDTCRRGSLDHYAGTTAAGGTHAFTADMGSTFIRFGTTAGDVSLTLGLRHAGNIPEKTSSFSVRDFGGC